MSKREGLCESLRAIAARRVLELEEGRELVVAQAMADAFDECFDGGLLVPEIAVAQAFYVGALIGAPHNDAAEQAEILERALEALWRGFQAAGGDVDRADRLISRWAAGAPAR